MNFFLNFYNVWMIFEFVYSICYFIKIYIWGEIHFDSPEFLNSVQHLRK